MYRGISSALFLEIFTSPRYSVLDMGGGHFFYASDFLFFLCVDFLAVNSHKSNVFF